jgi:general stress protein 26
MDDEMDREVPLDKKLDDLYEVIGDIHIAMFTTRRPDGMLVTRPMGTQPKKPVADFWFVTDYRTEKVDELAADPHVSLAYVNSKSWEWVSVSGTVTVSRDRALIRELYQADWRIWFPDEDAPGMDGGPDDPRYALLLVKAESIIYGVQNKSKPVALLEIAKGFISRQQPDVQDIREVSGDELR